MTRRPKKPGRSASQLEGSGTDSHAAAPAVHRTAAPGVHRTAAPGVHRAMAGGDRPAARTQADERRVANDEPSGDSVFERIQLVSRQAGMRIATLAVALGFF